jgi:ABC-type phosphonate transport system ATPase subunit
MSASSPLLEISHVSKAYTLDHSLSDMLARKPRARLQALRNVSLTVKPGEILGVVGESSASTNQIRAASHGRAAPSTPTDMPAPARSRWSSRIPTPRSIRA